MSAYFNQYLRICTWGVCVCVHVYVLRMYVCGSIHVHLGGIHVHV